MDRRLLPSRFPALLATATMGVYLLVIVGATTAVMDGAAACAAWPGCGEAFGAPSSRAGWIALGHRATALAVGLLLAATVGAAIRARPTRRVGFAVATAALLYPLQAFVGAAVAASADRPPLRRLSLAPDLVVSLSEIHLVTGLAIFGSLLAALAWTLESETGETTDSSAGQEGTMSSSGPTTAPEDLSHREESGSLIARGRQTLMAYFRLMKPRLMWLLSLVAAAAMALAGGPNFTPRVVGLTLVGGSLAIGASGTFNHVLERDVDRRMNRTSDRPLAVDQVSVRNATVFGFVLAAAALGLFASINLLTAGLGLVAIVFYSLIYTLVLKPHTVQNTVIGGAAGALPALIGWAAVTGTIGFGGLALALLVFLWTPAHFYNLALAYRDDYERAGFPMMPVIRGETATRRHVLWYLGATLAATAILASSSALDWLFALTGVAVGAVFLWAVVRLHYEQTTQAAFRAFHASNAYLGAVLLAIVFDTLAV